MLSIRALRPASPALVAGLVALTAASLSGVALADPPPVPPGFGGDPIAPGLYRLHGTDPDLPRSDLEPLRQIVGNARYVGMGETVHTSGGFYEMKHRLFRYLVEEMGFRALAWESPWVNAERVSAYVQTCEGTPEQALTGVFTVWRSEETAALLRWMCEWNTAHPNDRVHFYGFDIQRQARADGEALIAFLGDLGFGDDHPWIEGIRACDGVVHTFYPFQAFPETLYAQCQDALSAIEAHFDDHEGAIEQATSGEALGWARVRLAGEQAGQRYQLHLPIDFVAAAEARDRGMAFMVEAIHDLRFPHARTAIWGHNGHLIHDSLTALDFVGSGVHLTESLGDKYRVIGLAAHVTNVNWPALGYCGPRQFGTADRVEDALHAVGEGDLLVDMHPRGSFGTFLDPADEYSIGDFYPSSLHGNYDALVYLENSPKMQSLAWPVCQSP